MAPDISPSRSLRIVGLMSGTSMDGIDAAYVETDGEGQLSLGPFLATSYDSDFRSALSRFVASAPERKATAEESELERRLTELHGEAVVRLLAQMGKTLEDIDLVGFHGQTIWHRPAQRATWQMGDGHQLARMLGKPVVFDFRSADVEAGGQGAPLAPVFHAALARDQRFPLAVVNIGGVANITWIGGPTDLLAFDTGPGNGLIDDWVQLRGFAMDENGVLASRGKPRMDIVDTFLANPFLDASPPKSLDRYDFALQPVQALELEDGAATLTEVTAACIHCALSHCPALPMRLLVTGGGRHNPAIMEALARRTGIAVQSVDDLQWDGDAIEAQAFAYMAARSVRGLPISFPGTTGVPWPQTGGRLAEP